MSSAFAGPLIVHADSSSSEPLEKVPLHGEGSKIYAEVDLQKLIYQHPKSLPLDELDRSFVDAIPVCKELRTANGQIDVVHITPDGRPIIVEAKLWRNPQARREVIGQILDYATELSRWDFNQFDEKVRTARAREDAGSPKGLLELAGLSPNSPEAATFRDAVTRNLRRGDMLLLIVGDGIREGAGAIAGFLEDHGSLHFTFGLVEMAIYRLPTGDLLVQPRVIVQSEIAKRFVVELVGDALQLQRTSPEEPEAPDTEVSEAKQLIRDRYRQFWSPFIKKLTLADGDQPIDPPSVRTNQYFKMPEGSNAWVSAYLLQSNHRAGVYLTFQKGPTGDRLYSLLEADRDAIDKELGVPVKWESNGRKHWISSDESYPNGLLIENHAADIHAFMADRVDRYVSVFRPRLARLVQDGI